MIKRILINIRQLQFRYTGVQSYIYNLTLNLVKEYPKTTFELATLNYKSGNEFIENLKKHSNVSVVNTNGGKSAVSDIIFDHLQICKLINNQDVYFNPVNITPLFKKPGVKYVTGVLDLCTFIVPNTTTFQLKTYYKLFLPSSLKRADKIISISKSTKRDLINLFSLPESKISVVYLGVDSEFAANISPIEIKKNNLFLTMATSPRKNVSTVIKAFSLFSKNHPSVKYQIVVNNPVLSLEIKRLVMESGLDRKKVNVMANYVSKQKLSKLYTTALAFVYCPIYEGFGLPILEAMSRSCPVITSTTSSLPEVAGKSAIMVNPLSFKDIASAMSDIYNKKILRQKMTKEGLKNVKKFDWKISAKEIMALLNSI
jgi:glycosyltransferase involved in cell wall biosynthesis